jgi:hypothetical protein
MTSKETKEETKKEDEIKRLAGRKKIRLPA